MPLLRCPICKKQFDPADSPAMPFCSDRCRRVDLGRWLGEQYGIAREQRDTQREDADEDEN